MSLFTGDDIQAKAASQSQDAQAYIDQANSIGQQAATSVSQVAANYTACLRKNPIVGFVTCPFQSANLAKDLATQFTTALSNIFKTGESILSQISTNLASAFKSNLQNASEQFKDIGENLQKCIQDATANSTTADTSSK
jgi:hypothetical protein